MRAAVLVSGLIGLFCVIGCATSPNRDGFEDGADASTTTTDPNEPSNTETDSGFGGNPTSDDGGSPEGIAEVYGHSKDTLYKLDPTTKEITEVGTLDGCGPTIDLAIDEHGNVFADSATELYRVDKTSGRCTKIAGGKTSSFPTSLSFVPKGTLDANEEALVGYDDENYVRIDVKTGQKKTIGSLGVTGLISSGDIVSVKGGPSYLTVKPKSSKSCTGECAKCVAADCLVEIDPETGKVLKNWGPVDHKNVFGLAFWGGVVYGFDDTGSLFEISFSGSHINTNEIPMSAAPTGLSFWGAGSATSAPLGPK